VSIRKGELIGLQVEVIGATDPGHIGLRGRVVDETMKTLVIEKEGKEKMIQKKGALFRFDIRGGIEVHGEDILFRPEERIKRAR
jgi:ribonuclease P protein subunit POP4